MLQSEDHRGEDGDTDAEEEEKEANLLVALSDGHPQRLEAWTGTRTEEYFSFNVPTFSSKPHPEKWFQFSHLADLAATIMNCVNVTFPEKINVKFNVKLFSFCKLELDPVFLSQQQFVCGGKTSVCRD